MSTVVELLLVVALKIMYNCTSSVLETRGLYGNILRGIKSFYEQSSVCVRVAGSLSLCFKANKGLRQGGGMSPCLFNIYIDG